MTRDTDAIKSKIINKSRDLFSRYGLFKTTIDEISHALHMGKSSLYYYFRNKEDIFKAVIDKELEIFLEQIRKAVDETPAYQDKLRVFALRRMQCFKELSNAYSALRKEYLTDYGFIQEIRADYDRRELTFVQTLLEDGIAKGDFAVADIPSAAQAVIIALKGLEYEWVLKGDAIDIEKSISTLHTILLHGIARK